MRSTGFKWLSGTRAALPVKATVKGRMSIAHLQFVWTVSPIADDVQWTSWFWLITLPGARKALAEQLLSLLQLSPKQFIL